jgi:DNA transformation protein
VARKTAFIQFLREQMEGFAAVSVRRMFGGAGFFHEGLMFALVTDDTLYFKTDEASRARFETEGLPPFSYATKAGRHTLTSYWRAPERCLDDPDVMALWCRKAFEAALKASASKATAHRPKVKAARPR